MPTKLTPTEAQLWIAVFAAEFQKSHRALGASLLADRALHDLDRLMHEAGLAIRRQIDREWFEMGGDRERRW